MPTYEYVCVDCGHRVEVVQSFSDEPLQTCAVCGGRLRKVLHAVGIQFKGSGFYSTDRKAAQPMPRATKGEKVESNGSRPEKEASGAKPGGDSKAKPDAKSAGASAKSVEKSA